jgi:hypothetical protein
MDATRLLCFLVVVSLFERGKRTNTRAEAGVWAAYLDVNRAPRRAVQAAERAAA